ncbi:type IX secretion system sortase PorU [Bacteroidales bacterium OttesenSCG-928-M06]|nr:type IX secretion system sortase PorU [Bacteroidales bacterium OttesenSCG-928-M06]
MKQLNYIFGCLILFFNILSLQEINAQIVNVRYTYESVLKEGKWVKIRVKENGVYKLTYDDLKNMGFSEPSKVKIHGYGGWKLDEVFTTPYIDDLPEVAVWKSSKTGFKSGDYLLFYARGVIKWTYQSVNDIFAHENNPYDNYGYYFLTEREGDSREMIEDESYSGTTTEVTVFDDYLVHEKDSVAMLESGRELFGENFITSRSRNFDFNILGITNDPGSVYFSFAAGATKTEEVKLSIDGELFVKSNVSEYGDYQKGHLIESVKKWNGDKKNNFRINVTYSGTRGTAHLNFISLNFKRKLQFYNTGYTFFRHKDGKAKALKYVIENATNNSMVWNISDPTGVKLVKTTLQGSKISFSAAVNQNITEYVMVDPAKSFLVPEYVGDVENKNLHGEKQVDMVIIAPPAYYSFAEQLRDKHKEKQNLETLVVQPEWIYNEFSSGTRDATAYRRFMKMFYDRARLEGKGSEPKYLLLYGSGFFDNRHLTAEGKEKNKDYYLLTYQFKNSLHEQFSYGTDDYFGFLDDEEGVSLGSDFLDLGIGRFPVTSVEQARNAMEKVIGYMNDDDFGTWRNTLIFTSDDTDFNREFCQHSKQADDLAVYMETYRKEFIIAKSYMDAFQPIDKNGKRTYPDAKNKLLKTLDEGCLLMNYTGHGSPTGLSGEDMVNMTDITLARYKKLPLWITASCDFGKYDGSTVSGGEHVFLNKQSGGIALFTATRVVGSSNNAKLNRYMIKNLFPSTGNKYPTLGDAFRQAKRDMGSDMNKLNFILFGDPALVLNYPGKNEVLLENVSVNGEKRDFAKTVNFRALDEIVLEGAIIGPNKEVVNDFNGTLFSTIFDGRQLIEVTDEKRPDDYWQFVEYQNKIYMGNNEIKDGKFSFSFKVPLDISYNPSNAGKMNFYAWDQNLKADAIGTFLNYTLSGSNPDAEVGEGGPVIRKIYLNSEQFEDGGIVHETPYFYAEVYDDDGINVTGSGIGHDISICIDKNPAWTYSLNNYYQSKDAFDGKVGFSIPELPLGEHQLVFKVWDILNNSTIYTLSFKVEEGSKPQIDVKAAPNPAVESTKFMIIHDRPQTYLEIEVKIFDLTGRLVYAKQESGSNISYVPWDLIDNSGQRVNPGIYIYQAIVKTNAGAEATKSKKIVIQKQ